MPSTTERHWKRQLQRQMELLGQYKHKTCGTVTAVSDDITRKSVLDPYYYNLGTTFCVGCRTMVSSRECVVANGKTLYAMSLKLRKQAPLAFKIVRFLVIPLAAGIGGGVLGYMLSQEIAVAVGMAIGGLLLGWLFLSRLVATMLRGSGMLWE